MTLIQREFKAGSETLKLTVEADSRLRKYARWSLRGEVVHIRVPKNTTPKEIEELITNITARVVRQRKRANRRIDSNLMERAAQINEKYFNGELSWHRISP